MSPQRKWFQCNGSTAQRLNGSTAQRLNAGFAFSLADREMNTRSLSGWPLSIILALQFGLLYHSAINNSPTPDEYPHVIGGLHHLKNGGNQFYHVNPPLVKMLAAAPSLGEQIRLPMTSDFDYQRFSRPEFALGNRFFDDHPRAKIILHRARLVSIVIAMLGTAGVFSLSLLLTARNSQLANASILTATFASAIYAFSPFILGYAVFLQTDVTAATTLVWLVIAAIVWGRSPTATSTMYLGLIFGLALCTKYTLWLGFAILPLFLLSVEFSAALLIKGIIIYVFVCLIALLTVNALIGGHRPWQTLGEYQFVSQRLTDTQQLITDDSNIRGNRFAETFLSRCIVPLPPIVLEGVDLQIKDMQEDRSCVIFGRNRETGVWWYYLAGLLIKTPLGFLLIGVIAMTAFTIIRFDREVLIACLAFPAAILVSISINTQFNLHVRYAIPVYPFLCVLASIGSLMLWKSINRPLLRKGIAAVLMIGFVAGIAEAQRWRPCYLPFVNHAGIVAFGRDKAIAGSGLDWQHGWVQFADFLQQHHRQQDALQVLIKKPYYRSVAYAGIATEPTDASKISQRQVLIALTTDERTKLERFRHSFRAPPLYVIAGSIEVYVVDFSDAEWLQNSIHDYVNVTNSRVSK